MKIYFNGAAQMVTGSQCLKDNQAWLHTALHDNPVLLFIEALRRYLYRIKVRKVKPSDYKPSQHTFEKGDALCIVQEFFQFLSRQFTSRGEDELPLIEIE